MSKQNTGASKKRSTFGMMLRRLFLGERREMTVADERYDSPTKLAVKRFFRKPLATIAVIVLAAMFIFVLVGPMLKDLDYSYEEVYMKNIPPSITMMSLPKSMKDNPRSISSFGSFSLGVDKNGDVFVWGESFSEGFSESKDVMTVPQEVKDANILYGAAGYDHCVVIADDGTVYFWGNPELGQFGEEGRLADMMPYTSVKVLPDGNKIDLVNDKVKTLTCGYQTTAILMESGKLYAWGNTNAGAGNMESIYSYFNKNKEEKCAEVVFTNSAMFAITESGKFVIGNNSQFVNYQGKPLEEYIGERKVIDIAATAGSITLLLDSGELISMGQTQAAPTVPEGEKIVSIEGGTRHFVAITDQKSVIAWGAKALLGQTDIPTKVNNGSVATVFASGFQNYAFDENGKYVDAWGLSGHIMGTDASGGDVFSRIMHGGRMTMTIGAVSVVVASIIGIIIGCISGYFGGWVDMFLMRVTEIFGAIPFLPFALVLSAILQGSSLKEDYRIFIIMIILGLLSWTGLAHLVRGQILAEREKEFVIAAQSMGIKESRIAFKHILPNVISVILVSLTLNFATCMLTESSLSYLGFGVKLPRPTWGNMLNGCLNSIVIQNYWWRWLFPALFLAITVVCINIIGDSLRDVLDPKSEVEK